MRMSSRDVLRSIRRLSGRLAIGQILREQYLYEIHGPFVAVAATQPPTSFRRRLTNWLSALMIGLAHWSRLRRGTTPQTLETIQRRMPHTTP